MKLKNFLKKKMLVYGIFFSIVAIIAVIYTILVYFKKIDPNAKTFNTVTFIIGMFAFFILGLTSGNVANKNGLLEGLIAALVIILISLIVNLFVRVNFETGNFIKMGSYLLASGLGGVTGVNLKNRKTSEHL